MIFCSRLRKEHSHGFEHLLPLTGVPYISKSWDLIDHGPQVTRTERSDVPVAVCVEIQSANGPRSGGAEVNKANPRLSSRNQDQLAGTLHVTVSRPLSQLVETMQLKPIKP